MAPMSAYTGSMTAPVKTRVREEDYLATMTDEKPSLEFVNGEVFQKPVVKRSHLIVADEVLAALRDYRRRAGGVSGPEATVNFSWDADRRYRVPDVAYWAADRPLAQENGILLPPTVAVEIRSEGQSIDDLRDMCREYRSRGVDVCWLIDPEARIGEVFDATRDGETVPSDGALEAEALPGFKLELPGLWHSLANS